MFYLSLAMSIAWLVYFAYLFFLHWQVRDLHRRLEAHCRQSQNDS